LDYGALSIGFFQSWRILMHRICLAFSAFALASTSAIAADLQPIPVFDWTGAYVGAFASYSTLNSTASLGGVSDKVNLDGFGGGMLLGYNYQMDSLVLGMEADVAFQDVDGSSSLPAPHTQEIDTTFGGRVRLGYAIDNTLLFIQGGIAAAQFDADLAGGGGIASDTLVGFQVGAGLEYAFTDNWTMRADYLYTDYESVVGNPPVKFSPDGHTFRLGISYLF
jgi:outer membrane immunogenic protein